ncbi:hypothetical protein EAI_13928 [Harpegnathos saltator]|uniref:Uncharacterized protein n=1 Tax=Harpegnathos saltator TaxID=610380 RepID=E2C243_HARSA|nr:hypothetical protein EAI_13928 [Harpegnathos saltator]
MFDTSGMSNKVLSDIGDIERNMLVQCINAQIWRKRNIFKTLQCSMIFSAARPVGYIETKTIVWVGNRSCEMKRRAILLIDLLT